MGRLCAQYSVKGTFSNPAERHFIHLGGNDIESLSNCKIFNLMKSGVKYLTAAFPSAKIILCEILPRIGWAQGSVWERKRKRVNSEARKLCHKIPGLSVFKADIDVSTLGFFRDDGVHLSDVGLAFFVDAMSDHMTSIFGGE